MTRYKSINIHQRIDDRHATSIIIKSIFKCERIRYKTVLSTVMPVVSLFVLATVSAARRWAVIFDAGSTGSRVRIYSWLPAPFGCLPSVRAVPGGNLKVRPGISSFHGNPKAAGKSILPLVRLAENVIPQDVRRHALVLLRATAGMRLLPPEKAQVIYDSLLQVVRENSDFQPRAESFSTLSGTDEGIFGWLSVNYLYSHTTSLSAQAGNATSFTIGALDLGGASTQITMLAAKGTPNSVAVPLPGSNELASVFTYSHLGYGSYQVSTRQHH